MYFYNPGALLLIYTYMKVSQVAEGLEYLHKHGIIHGDIRGVRPHWLSVLIQSLLNISLVKYTTGQ